MISRHGLPAFYAVLNSGINNQRIKKESAALLSNVALYKATSKDAMKLPKDRI